MYTRILVLFLLALATALALPVAADNHRDVSGIDPALKALLTPDELAFLNQHPIIRVNGPSPYAPFAFVDRTGQPRGLGIDYVIQILSMAGRTNPIFCFWAWRMNISSGIYCRDLIYSMTIVL